MRFRVKIINCFCKSTNNLCVFKAKCILFFLKCIRGTRMAYEQHEIQDKDKTGFSIQKFHLSYHRLMIGIFEFRGYGFHPYRSDIWRD